MGGGSSKIAKEWVIGRWEDSEVCIGRVSICMHESVHGHVPLMCRQREIEIKDGGDGLTVTFTHSIYFDTDCLQVQVPLKSPLFYPILCCSGGVAMRANQKHLRRGNECQTTLGTVCPADDGGSNTRQHMLYWGGRM